MTHLFITGGTGFIGKRLCQLALARNMSVSVLSRQSSQQVKSLCGAAVNAIDSLSALETLPPIDHVINLAGEPILNGRWSSYRKQVLRDSRIELTRQLINALAKLPQKPSTLISGSAIGIYGDRGDRICSEAEGANQDFAATLCEDWERAASPVTALKMRLCIVRIGVVLDPSGGPLTKMRLPFKYGLGGRIGDGQQWFSWITLDDLCSLLFFLMENDYCSGVFNATSPEPIRNADFTHALAAHLHRPAVLPMPACMLKAALGEASALMLGSQRVVPKAALAAGFEFQHPTLDRALATMKGI